MENSNPQKEDGYTAIANEILEQLTKITMSNYEFRVLFSIIRKTYGFQKKTDRISLSQFEILTNIKSCHICRTLKKLLKRNMIIKSNGGYGLQKKYNLWILPKQALPKQALPKQVKLPKQVIKVTQTGNKKLPKQVDTKETYKETIKENICEETKKPTTPLQNVVLAYKQIKGFAKDDKEWDKRHFSRFTKSAKQLLDAFGNNESQTIEYLKEHSKELENKGLEWTLETLVKRVDDWKLNKNKSKQQQEQKKLDLQKLEEVTKAYMQKKMKEEVIKDEKVKNSM